MKALTIWQPWATLIMAGVKPYEFRVWPAPRALRGTRIAIHAGARPVRKAELKDLIIRLRSSDAWSTALKPEALAMLERWHSNPAALPMASILGTAVLGEPKRAFDIVAEFGATRLNDSDRDEHANWAWPLTDIEPLQPIQPAKGLQGFWNWRPA
ncbi:ASCH domain-containing protein [Mesorhizobium sp. B2-4-7]|uniref:ASCH domain-containing protein n=1 Tax=Mesorhizobium sp. B2-4-7 TaxID=2589942 RepID=UPI00112B578E|nr:ASCH domain-containing protein [Mesorhizobium sp. B2-4-7]TPL30221.1 ASCH domain-containing protein [Mesorhizobium sp. B2-4-7]